MQTTTNILIIEDEAQIAEFIDELLKTQGYACRICENFAQLASITPAFVPDLILIDVMLSYQSGFEVATRLQSDRVTRGTPFIFITARSDISSLLLGFELGAVDYIVKPFKPAELIARVNVAMRQRMEMLRIIQQNEYLQHHALKDALTGIKNKHFMLETLRYQAGVHNRYGEPFAYMLIDIDHLQQVSDRRGIQTSNDILAELVTLLSENMRQADLLGRYGNDEFLILCPHTALQPAAELAHRILSLIREASFVAKSGQPNKITVSIGVGSTPPVRQQAFRAVNADDIVAALYEAKKNGRNRVVLYHSQSGLFEDTNERI